MRRTRGSVILVLAVLAGCCVACVPDTPAPSLVYQSNTVRLTAAEVGVVTSWNPLTGELVVPTGSALDTPVGTVLSGPTTAAVPGGLLVRVTGKSVAGGVTTLQTAPAAIDELVASGTLSVDHSAESDDLALLEAADSTPALRAGASQVAAPKSFCGVVAGLDVCLEVDTFDVVWRETVAVVDNGTTTTFRNAVGVRSMSGRVTATGASIGGSGVLNVGKVAKELLGKVRFFGFGIDFELGIAYDVSVGAQVDLSIPFTNGHALLNFDCVTICAPTWDVDLGLADDVVTTTSNSVVASLSSGVAANASAMIGIGASLGIVRSVDRTCGETSATLIGGDAFVRAGPRGNWNSDRPAPVAAGWFSEYHAGVVGVSAEARCKIVGLLGSEFDFGGLPSADSQLDPVWLTPKLALVGSESVSGKSFTAGASFATGLGHPLEVGVAQLDGQWPDDESVSYPSALGGQNVELEAVSTSSPSTVLALGSSVSDSVGRATFAGASVPAVTGTWRLRARGGAATAPVWISDPFTVTEPTSSTEKWYGNMSMQGSISQSCDAGISFCGTVSYDMEVQVGSSGSSQWSLSSVIYTVTKTTVLDDEGDEHVCSDASYGESHSSGSGTAAEQIWRMQRLGDQFLAASDTVPVESSGWHRLSGSGPCPTSYTEDSGTVNGSLFPDYRLITAGTIDFGDLADGVTSGQATVQYGPVPNVLVSWNLLRATQGG